MSIPGIDVSDYQDPVDWQTVKNSGIQFAIIKATEGQTWKARTFKEKWRDSKQVGMIRGAYHFFRPNRTGQSQAENFLDMLAEAGGLQENDIAPVLDLEVRDGINSSTIKERCLDWLETIETRTGRKPIIYVSPGFWNGLSGGSAEFADYPLWVAHYTRERPNIPGRWRTCAIWQYTDQGRLPGINGNVDFNWFNGDLNGLQDFAQGNTSGVMNHSTFEDLINRGERGNIVQNIQQRLINAGFDVGPSGADGIFGAQTEAAVERFQRANNLPINGIVDPATQAKL
jgi:lysozyme